MERYLPEAKVASRPYLNAIAARLGIPPYQGSNEELLAKIGNTINEFKAGNYVIRELPYKVPEPHRRPWDLNDPVTAEVARELNNIAYLISNRTTITGIPDPDDFYEGISIGLDKFLASLKIEARKSGVASTAPRSATSETAQRTRTTAATAATAAAVRSRRSSPPRTVTRTRTRPSNTRVNGGRDSFNDEEIEEALRRSLLEDGDNLEVGDLERELSTSNLTAEEAALVREALSEEPRNVIPENGRASTRQRTTAASNARPRSPTRQRTISVTKIEEELPNDEPLPHTTKARSQMDANNSRSRVTEVPESSARPPSPRSSRVGSLRTSRLSRGALTERDYDKLIEEAARDGNTAAILELLLEKKRNL